MKIPATDEETLEDDVNYGIADCRRRLRSQRSTLRAQHPPKDGSNVDVHPAAGRVGSYAEVELEEAVIT
ncbi:MAG TPA: hypothetical protein VF290_16575 [Pyrinomonadaceae bacterium]